MTHRRVLTVIISVLGISLFFGMQKIANNKDEMSRVTSFSKGVMGTSIFHSLASKLKGNAVKVKKRAVLNPEFFDDIDLHMILSPTAPISAREATLLYNFVFQGGTLIISFHNKPSFKKLEALFDYFEWEIEPHSRHDFKNRNSETLLFNSDSNLLRSNTSYEFYSYYGVDQKFCKPLTLGCFWKEEQVGGGKVILLAGLPPFGNALIHQSNNNLLAFALIDQFESISIDEYHHLFTEKTLFDLFMEPSFSLPLLGMLLGALLFFFFGKFEFSFKRKFKRKNEGHSSHHDLNKLILKNFMKDKTILAEGVAKQVQYLERLFPDQHTAIHKAQVDEIETFSLSRKLLALHKQFLHQRGSTKL